MSRRTWGLEARVRRYLLEHSLREPPVLAELREATASHPHAGMQISPEQGQFMALLVQAIGAKRAIEIGTFTGYSALCVARALPADGRLLCCDVNEQWTAIARRYWERAGVADKITLKLGPGMETLRALPETTRFDFAFIDADKANYRNYYEECLKRMRPDGLILIDNVLWSGKVIDPGDSSDNTRAIREFNDFVAGDERVEAVMIPLADGLTIARKK